MLRSATGVPGTSLAVALILAGGPGTARGQFALFVNETFERSVGPGSLFANDVEEKDFAVGEGVPARVMRVLLHVWACILAP